jgi:hypothetical protein
MHWLTVVLATASLLLAGCSTPVVRSNVTTFEEWPANLANKSYVFERTQEQSNNLEYRNYENLVRGELNRLGFKEALEGKTPELKASFEYGNTARDMRVIYPVAVDPYWPGAFWPGPYWRHSPFYDPFWYGPPMVQQQDESYVLYTHHLRIVLARASDGKQLYNTTVISEGTYPSLAAVMPYMVRSAFSNFPGQNGTSRVVELEIKK